MTTIFLKKQLGTPNKQTHLSLIGGTYNVKDTNEFYEHLVEDFKNDKKYHLVEKITEPFVLYVDVEKGEKDKEIPIEKIAKVYQEQLVKFYDVEKSQTNYTIIYKTSGCRNRAHIHFTDFNIKTKAEAKFIREQVLECKELNIQDPKSIDESAYNTGLRMLGSYKADDPKHPNKDLTPYTLDRELTIEDFTKYSIRLSKSAIVADFKEPKLLKKRKIVEPVDEISDTDVCLISGVDDIIKELCSCLSNKRTDEYSSWVNLGILLKSLSSKSNTDYFPLYLELSKKSTKFDGAEALKDLWESFQKYDLYNINTLYYWANIDNQSKLKKIREKSISRNILYALSGSHLAISKLMYYQIHQEYAVDKDLNWFKFNKTSGIWNSCLKSNKEIYQEFLGMQKILRTELKTNTNLTIKQQDCIKVIIKNLGNEGFTGSIMVCMAREFQDPNLEFDKNGMLLGFTNGVINLKTGEFGIGNFSDYVMTTVGYDYTWRDTEKISKIMEQIHPDKSIRDYYLQNASRCLDGKIKQTFSLDVGFQGANGKSFITDLRHKALGSYSARGSTSIITGEREEGGSTNSSIVKLKGKRNVYFCEPSAKKKINIATLKELTGGDEIAVRGLYKEEETFNPVAFFSANLNRLGKLDDCDGGVRRRMEIFRFNSRFVENPVKPNEFKINYTYQDPEILLELAKDYMQLLLEYYLNETRFIKPKSITDETNEYLDENDPIKEFCDTYIHKRENAVLTKKDLKLHYKNHFEKSFNKSDFYKSIELTISQEFQRDKQINGTRYKDFIEGYYYGEEIDLDETEL